jgi:hypothetical protein
MNIAIHSFIDVEVSRKRRLQAMAMQEIEGNPLSDDQVAMFEMFEREGWSYERRRRFLDERFMAARLSAAE